MSKRTNAPRPPQLTPDATVTPPFAPALPRAAALFFAPPILTGALLLFAVQPLIARYVLPWFGGAPAVWTTCMLFFQALLLGGYLYAHLLVRFLPTRGQILLHLTLLAGALLLVPIIPAVSWKPGPDDDPTWRILLLLGATIGLPYLVLSATSPLLQAWFVRASPGASPYRLFALSNLGSLLALLGYPIVLEPFFTRQQQAWIWSIGLILFAGMCLACAAHVWKSARNRSPEADAPAHNRERELAISTRLLWIALPMVASVLLLAITNTLTEDVAVAPLLWVIPLSLYLLTFIIAFDSPRWYLRRTLLVLLPLCALWVLRLRVAPLLQWDVTLLEQFLGYLTSLFVICMFCHGEVARIKPHPRDLTWYYLAIAVGGALGGVFVGLIAPRVFNQLHELPIGILAAGLLSFAALHITPVRRAEYAAGLFVILGVSLLLGIPALQSFLQAGRGTTVLERSRNFYGTLTVVQIDSPDPEQVVRVLNHGTTSHGAQTQGPINRNVPTLYYRPNSGIGILLSNFPRQGRPLRVGLVGLGVGTLAAYGQPGDTFRAYEINPDVERLARKYFTFLDDSPAETEVILGDARLTMEYELERQQAQNYDVLVLDAFSGDAIPTHLLTAEAFDVYMRHLRPGGVIAVHFSNRSVDLSPILLRQAHRLNMAAAVGDPRVGWWMLMTQDEGLLNTPELRQQLKRVQPSDRGPLWTDDYVNLVQAIRWVPGGGRR